MEFRQYLKTRWHCRLKVMLILFLSAKRFPGIKGAYERYYDSWLEELHEGTVQKHNT